MEQVGLHGAKIQAIQHVGGGCINTCFRLHTSCGTFFIKVNDASRYSGLFASEAKGLSLIEAACPGFTPWVKGWGCYGAFQWLLLEFVESGRRQSRFWEQFAQRLVQLHRSTNDFFGLDHENYIGQLVQSNTAHATWVDFYGSQRLLPQVQQAVDQKRMPLSALKKCAALVERLPQWFPVEPPSLLHGDLWAGNFLIDKNGWPRVIDPAVYYGFREMDLAMMRLFGGFDEAVFRCYEELFPLQPGARQRVPLCQLYPLLVHANLFGGNYVQQVLDILDHFV